MDIDTRHFVTEDGTVIEYREKDSTFNLARQEGPVLVKAAYVEVHATEAGAGAKTTGSGVVDIRAAAKVEITAPEITLNGHMTFNGEITHTGNMATTGMHTDANGIHMARGTGTPGPRGRGG